MANISEIKDLLKAYVSGYGFALNSLCTGTVYELTYSDGLWFSYSKMTSAPIVTESITIVVAEWKPKEFAGLVQSVPVVVYSGGLPAGTSIPSDAVVYTIRSPLDGLVRSFL